MIEVIFGMSEDKFEELNKKYQGLKGDIEEAEKESGFAIVINQLNTISDSVSSMNSAIQRIDNDIDRIRSILLNGI